MLHSIHSLASTKDWVVMFVLSLQVPLQLIESVECQDLTQLHLTCKDCKIIRYVCVTALLWLTNVSSLRLIAVSVHSVLSAACALHLLYTYTLCSFGIYRFLHDISFYLTIHALFHSSEKKSQNLQVWLFSPNSEFSSFFFFGHRIKNKNFHCDYLINLTAHNCKFISRISESHISDFFRNS